jgi:hypothetical protein
MVFNVMALYNKTFLFMKHHQIRNCHVADEVRCILELMLPYNLHQINFNSRGIC